MVVGFNLFVLVDTFVDVGLMFGFDCCLVDCLLFVYIVVKDCLG